MKNLTKLIPISLIVITFAFFGSCKKDVKVIVTDDQLLEMAKVTSGFVWYKNSDALLSRSTLSGHSEPFLRTRYNLIAATMLNDQGKVKNAIIFPEGSLIVKELLNSSNDLSKYAILYKKTGHKDADSDGWVWGYLKKDGTVVEPSSNKGIACKLCHIHEGNINFTLMNVAIP